MEFSAAALKAGLFVVWQMAPGEEHVRRKASLAFHERSRVYDHLFIVIYWGIEPKNIPSINPRLE